MTHTTEQERADFEAWALINMATYRTPEWMFLKNKSGEYTHFDVNLVWSAWQAARRDPAIPVPQGLREAAQRAHDWMDSQADSQSKGNYHSFDLLCLRQERDALAEALAAAPQPPEADHIPDAGKMVAAPVQLPKPVAIITDTVPREPGWKTMFVPDSGTRLYTEHQVRQLLAARGIEVAQ